MFGDHEMWNMLCHFSLKKWDGWKYMNMTRDFVIYTFQQKCTQMKMTLMIGIKWEQIGLVEKKSIYRGINL